MTDREVMQMALDALEKHVHEYEAIQTLRTALAQPEPEPVAWWHDMGDVVDLNISGHGTPLYTAPPKKEWVGLTHTELEDCILISKWATWIEVGRAIEQALKDKNT